MRKIFASGLILAVLLALSMSVPALANVGSEEDINYVENVNRRIQHLIDKAIEKAEVALANGDEAEILAIRMDLAFTAGEIVVKAIEWAENKGLILVHYDVVVTVGGYETVVDPIHVLW